MADVIDSVREWQTFTGGRHPHLVTPGRLGIYINPNGVIEVREAEAQILGDHVRYAFNRALGLIALVPTGDRGQYCYKVRPAHKKSRRQWEIYGAAFWRALGLDPKNFDGYYPATLEDGRLVVELCYEERAILRRGTDPDV